MKKKYRIFFLMDSNDEDNIIPLGNAYDTIEDAEAEVERMIAKDIIHDWTYLIIPQYSKQ